MSDADNFGLGLTACQPIPHSSDQFRSLQTGSMDVVGKLRQNRLQLGNGLQLLRHIPTNLEIICMKINRLLLSTTFASLLLFGTSLYAQQDVNPSWYDPFPPATNASAPLHIAKPLTQPKAVSGLAGHQLGDSQAQRLVSQQAGHKNSMSQKQQLLTKNAESASNNNVGLDREDVGPFTQHAEGHAVSGSGAVDEAAIAIAPKQAAIEPGLEATR